MIVAAASNAASALASPGEACDSGGLVPRVLDALFVCTCTGYPCPGVLSHLAEQTDVRSDAFLNDMTGLGCGARSQPCTRHPAFLRRSGCNGRDGRCRDLFGSILS